MDQKPPFMHHSPAGKYTGSDVKRSADQLETLFISRQPRRLLAESWGVSESAYPGGILTKGS
jgi:hypothetical protein